MVQAPEKGGQRNFLVSKYNEQGKRDEDGNENFIYIDTKKSIGRWY